MMSEETDSCIRMLYITNNQKSGYQLNKMNY